MTNVIAHLPVSFVAGSDYVGAVFHTGGTDVGIRFESTEELLSFFEQLIERATKVWPDDSWIKEYLSD
ncbi:MAG: hypothetical protein XU15_C0011G0162 [candidate division NC10 bacterium CSP1-5]|nr:MAG: hypothetical protein XU15_C0011G0018 [candidate division NC10 bacterium CSP1-5]KRT69480.1 MAG: hypothetical protein XU15_C0011G0162 [candidate division NC10 bacterium CSP1-5]